jgi:hypothetical protein
MHQVLNHQELLFAIQDTFLLSRHTTHITMILPLAIIANRLSNGNSVAIIASHVRLIYARIAEMEESNQQPCLLKCNNHTVFHQLTHHNNMVNNLCTNNHHNTEIE